MSSTLAAMSASRISLVLFTLACAFLGAACQEQLSPAQEAQIALIKAEPRGSHYIGRRYYVEKTRFWGYLRRPGEPWQKSRLVVMNEDVSRTPDRLPELGAGQNGYGFDHNYEYKIKGRYTGEQIYDPNSNLFLPEFRLESFELISAVPGWLFSPDDRYDSKKLPAHR
ncbi:MAG: hypothetical protein ACR2RV_08825 [Verrucomicrobiales bacterium]